MRTSCATPAATRPSVASRSRSASSRFKRASWARARDSSSASARMPSETSASSRSAGRATGASRSRPRRASDAFNPDAPRWTLTASWSDANTSASPAMPRVTPTICHFATHVGTMTGNIIHANEPRAVRRAPTTIVLSSVGVWAIEGEPVAAPSMAWSSSARVCGSRGGEIETAEAPRAKTPPRIPSIVGMASAGPSPRSGAPSATAMSSSCCTTRSRARSTRWAVVVRMRR